MKFAIIKTGGKQYLVRERDEITVDKLPAEKGTKVELAALAVGDDTEVAIEIGRPLLKQKITGEIVDNVKGDKIRVARFKAKTRYRKVTGFRAQLTRVKIINI